MSNERIDQILAENNLEYTPQVYPNMYPRIIKSIEQYGGECYEGGKKAARDICYEVLDPEITRLRSLVHAQKELINALNDQVDEEKVSWENRDKIVGLYKKIKELEK